MTYWPRPRQIQPPATDRETAAIGKRFHGVADAGAHAAGTDAQHDGADIKHFQRARPGIDEPAERDENAARGDHQFRTTVRTERIDDPSFKRGEPGFQRDEDAERDLDAADVPGMGFRHRADEVSPAVLEIGDHPHADDADDELHPAVAVGRGLNWCGGWRWSSFPPDARFLETDPRGHRALQC